MRGSLRKLNSKINSYNVDITSKDASVQCEIQKYDLNLYAATFVSVTKYLTFDTNTRYSSKKNLTYSEIVGSIDYESRDVGVQTYDLDKKRLIRAQIILQKGLKSHEDEDSTEQSSFMIEAIESFILKASQLNSFSKENLKKFALFLYQLNKDSLFVLKNYCFEEAINQADALAQFNSFQFKVLEMMLLKAKLKLDKEKAVLQSQLNGKQAFINLVVPLGKFITYAIEKGARNKERRKQAIERFNKLIRFVMINREWLKNLNRKRRRDLATQYKDYENNKIKFNTKKAIILFDKDQYKAEHSLIIITGAHRKILLKQPSLRTADEIEMLDKIVMNIARLNAFPKHIRQHIAQLLELVAYDKGREIVREGHESIGFYIILTGGCDVLFNDVDGIMKIDELQVGDTFGSNSFKKNGVTPNTVITNQATELIMVTPGEIESFIQNLRKTEYDDTYKFISNWLPTKYWDWNEENFKQFINYSTFSRFTKCEIIYGNSKQISETIYFILSGKIELLRLLRLPCSEKKVNVVKNFKKKTDQDTFKLYRVCTLISQNYFGIDDESSIDSWYIAQNDVNILSISVENFKKIHPYAEFLFLKLKEDIKFWIPSITEDLKYYNEAVEWETFVASLGESTYEK